jgi:hypothetical protein
MNILKAQSRTRRLIAEENDQGPGFSKFEVYGIHSLKFIDRVSSATNGPAALSGMPAEAARELEVGCLFNLVCLWPSSGESRKSILIPSWYCALPILRPSEIRTAHRA